MGLVSLAHNLRKYVAYKAKSKQKQAQSMVLVLEKPALKPSDNSMPPYRTQEADQVGFFTLSSKLKRLDYIILKKERTIRYRTRPSLPESMD